MRWLYFFVMITLSFNCIYTQDEMKESKWFLGKDLMYLKIKNADIVRPFMNAYFSEGMCPVFIDRDRNPNTLDNVGYIDKKGNIVLELGEQYGKIWPFHDGLALFKQQGGNNDGCYGYINKKGAVVIPAIYEKASDFCNGFALVEKGSEAWYINKKGKNVFNNDFGNSKPFSEGLAVVNDGENIINIKGKVIISIESEMKYYGTFSEGLIRFYSDKGTGFADTKGHVVYLLKYDSNIETANYSDGLLRINTRIGKKSGWGYLDREGNIVIEPIYDYAGDFSEGYACVMKYSSDLTLLKVYLINKNNEIVIELPSRYEGNPHIGKFREGILVF